MRPPFPRTRLGLFRGGWILAEVALLGVLVASTGSLGALRDRWEMLTRTPGSRGAQVYQINCAGCHGGSSGGSVTDQPPKHNTNGHTWEHADCELLEVVRAGMTPAVAAKRPPGTAPAASAMPAFVGRLDDDDIRDVIAYLRTLWTAEQRAFQRTATGERCAG